MSVYDVDFSKVVKQHTPVDLRQPKRLAWLRTLIAAVVTTYNSFMTYRSKMSYYLAHNSQICYMEAVLNDEYDNDDRLIYIDDGPFIDIGYIFLVIEETPVWLALVSELPEDDYEAPLWVYTDAESSISGPQFIVYYPDGMSFVEAQMRALINKYRLPSKWNYSIVAYTP